MAQRSSVSFASANIPGLPLESVFHQDEEDGPPRQSRARWCDVVAAILVKPGSMTAVSPKALFPPQASSRERCPTDLFMYEARQMVLPTFPPSVQETE
jgi:hypothetical protein